MSTTSAKITMSSQPTKPVNFNVSPKPHPKRDVKFLAQLDFDSIQAHFDDMSKEEHDALDKELGHKNFRGPSIPYDDGSDIAYEEELMLLVYCATKSSTIDAKAVYAKAWQESAYTSFFMLQFLIEISNRSWDDFVASGTWDNSILDHALDNIDPVRLVPLWENGDGLCTSFTIFVCECIEGADFIFQNSSDGGHRAAVSPSGLVVDSSARTLLSGDEGEEMKGFKGTWKFVKVPHLTLSFRSIRDATFKDFTRCKAKQRLLKNAYVNYMEQKDLYVYFGMTIASGNLRFNGKIEWDVVARKITWSSRGVDGFEESCAIFNRDGNFMSQLDCLRSIRRFGMAEGRSEQYSRVRIVLNMIWKTSVDIFGFPQLYEK
ncbi:hypothetical protein MaudCBS49596_004495 [Microsporum audouinii]